jgi:hypothetical protein
MSSSSSSTSSSHPSSSARFTSDLSFSSYASGLFGLVTSLDRLWDIECDQQEFLIVCSTLHKILTNIILHPAELKYRSLSLSNAALQRRLLRFPSASEFLTCVGFGLSIEQGESKLTLSKIQENTETIEYAREILEKAQNSINQEMETRESAESATEESMDEQVYEVEMIKDERLVDGQWEVLVHWRGYSAAEDTWEPLENILDKQIITDFRQTKERKNKEIDEIPPVFNYDITVFRPALNSLYQDILRESDDKCDQQEKFHRSLLLLDRLASNLLLQDEQYRRINLDKDKLKYLITPYKGALNFLTFIGFQPLDPQQVNGAIMEFKESEQWKTRIERSRAIIKLIAAEFPIDQQLKELKELGPIDRNVQVFEEQKRNPEQTIGQSSSVESGDHSLIFAVAAAERRKIAELSRTDVIVTKQKREEIKAEKRRIYHETIIRCSFPNEKCAIQMSFRPQEKIEQLFKELSMWIETGEILLTMIPATPVTLSSHGSLSFQSAGLIPAASFIVKQSGALKQATLALKKPINYQENRVPTAANAAELENIKRKEIEEAKQLITGSKQPKVREFNEEEEIERRIKLLDKHSKTKAVPKWAAGLGSKK